MPAFSCAVLVSTIQIYVAIAMAFVAGIKMAFETWLALFHRVDLVVSLGLLDVPTPVARRLHFRLSPNVVKLATVRYLDNLKQLVVSVFAHIQRKVLEKFDDALRVAGALDVADLDTIEISQDPTQRRRTVCEQVALDIVQRLLIELESIVLPKASKMMSQIMKHEPTPPGAKDQVVKASKRILVEKKLLIDPGKVLTKMMLYEFKRELPLFVHHIVTRQYDLGHVPFAVANEHMTPDEKAEASFLQKQVIGTFRFAICCND